MWNILTTVGVVATSAIVAPLAVTGIVGALGFQAGGIVAGSAAAGIMASSGGAVAAGSICAVLQSVGAVGLGVGGTIATSAVGVAGAGGILAARRR